MNAAIFVIRNAISFDTFALSRDVAKTTTDKTRSSPKITPDPSIAAMNQLFFSMSAIINGERTPIHQKRLIGWTAVRRNPVTKTFPPFFTFCLG